MLLVGLNCAGMFQGRANDVVCGGFAAHRAMGYGLLISLNAMYAAICSSLILYAGDGFELGV